MPAVTIVTPVLPASAEFLPDAAHSVRATEHHLATVGWNCEWVIVVDGLGALPKFTSSERTHLIRLPVRSGQAAARNRALAAARGDWLICLDADDLLLPHSVADLLSHPGMAQVAWVATNRVTVDGAKTPHWMGAVRTWLPGELATVWTAPFPFHPGGVVVRRDTALAVGGWPALGTNEDLGFVLTLSEQAAGASVPNVLLRHRVWDGQLSASPQWAAAKKEAFWTLTELLNARRAALGRYPVAPPESGGAYGRAAV